MAKAKIRNPAPKRLPEKSKTDGDEQSVATDGTLEQWLWKAACSIRGPVDAPKFKDYILPLVFIKRLSDVFDDELTRLADKFGGTAAALELVTEDHSLVRFYIPPEASWARIRKITKNLGQELTDVVRAVAKANPLLQGVIDIVDFNATVSGQRIVDDARLDGLVEILSKHPLGLHDVEPDILGRAYEFLLRKFAEGQGQSAGEFFTPKEVGWLIARLLEPAEGMTVYDPACGSAGLLIKAQLVLREKNKNVKRPLGLYGQEFNHVTYAIAKMNMIVHDMEGEVAIGDTLRGPKFVDKSKLQAFDLVVANPMWNQPGYGADFYEADALSRFGFGHPPERSADWGWLQHMLASLNKSGRAGVVLDAAAVSRGSGEDQNKEKLIRQRFVDDDLIESVILLPDNIFYNTTAQGIIVVLNRSKPKGRAGEVLLIDVSEEYGRLKPKNALSDVGVSRTLEAFHDWKSIEGFSKVVTCEDVVGRDYNLNPARYIARAAERVPVDIADTLAAIDKLSGEQADLEVQTRKRISGLVAQPGNGLPKGWREVALGDVATFVLGRTPARKKPEYFTTSGGTPWVTITDMAGQIYVRDTKEQVSKSGLADAFKGRLVSAGTLLMSIKLTVGRTAFMGVDGVHNEAIVSISPDEGEVLARFLYYLLPLVDYRQYQDRAVKGQTINLGKLRQMKLVLPPVGEQAEIVEVLDGLQDLAIVGRELLATRITLRDEIVHKLARGELGTEKKK